MDQNKASKIVPLESRLLNVQSELKGAKSNNNDFGKYKYRNVEDILSEVKPLLNKHELSLRMTDQIVVHADQVYIQACVIISDLNGEIIDQTGNPREIISIAYAREPEKQGGMSPSQITGSASSYARKYALGGMFLISGEACPDYASQLESQHGSDVTIGKILQSQSEAPSKPLARGSKAPQDKDKDKDKVKDTIKFRTAMDMLNEQK